MTATPELDRLSARLGILPDFCDGLGRHRNVGEETLRRLAAAMGFPAETEADALLSVERLEAGSDRFLDSVCVVPAGEGAVIPFSPLAGAAGEISWQLTAEDGRIYQGDAKVAELERQSLIPGTDRCHADLSLSAPLSPGYYRLDATGPGGDEASMTVVATPGSCLTPDDLGLPERSWGLAAQLYGLRSAGNWGIGDYGDLGRLAEIAGTLGATLVGVSPLHALFPADPDHYGPYGPSSRQFLNVFHIDVSAVPDLADCEPAQRRIGSVAFQRALNQVRDANLIDYPAVWSLKRTILELLFQTFRANHLDSLQPTRRGQDFLSFLEAMGQPLQRLGVFEALHEHHFGTDPAQWSWRTWPVAYRRPDSPEVANFAERNADRVLFFQYLQWLADRQLGHAAELGHAAGTGAGLYRDLAVAVEAGGADAWSDAEAIVTGATVGAPSDEFNPLGQNWGLAPYSPLVLREQAYRPFIAMLRANMRHARVLRIDHAMNLQRLFWIPSGTHGAVEGAYVSYPVRDLVGMIALESHRNRCLVVGEDLGTVPDGFRQIAGTAGIHSYRVLYFERGDDGSHHPPEAYPAISMAVATTHDLPTLKGFWCGRDLAWRRRLGLYADEESMQHVEADRAEAKRALLAALVNARLARPDWGDPGARPFDDLLFLAVHRYLSRTPARFIMVSLDDLVGEVEQPNLPGTRDEHPNWRRRLILGLEQCLASETLRALASAIVEERGR